MIENENNEIVLTDSQISFATMVDTPFGKMRFLTFEEYLSLQSELGWIAQNVLHIYYMIRNTIPKENKEERKELASMKSLALREIVLAYPQILVSYQIVLGHMFDQNDYILPSTEEEPNKELESFMPILADIFSTDESFLLIRDYIMKMNLLREDKVSPNPKIQELFERDREVNKVRFKDSPTNSDIIFSVASLTPNPLDKVQLMSPLQVHNIYARISADKNYQAGVLYSTVTEWDVESWSKKIDLFEVKDTSISKAAFDQRNEGMFK